MKKLLSITFIALFISSGIGFAQEKAFVFGFNVSPNIGWFKTETKGFIKEGISPGVSWGFIADFHLLENYAISTGFNVAYIYGKMNFDYNYDLKGQPDKEGKLTRKYKLQYLEIPLALKMKTNPLGKIRIYGIIGLGTSFLIRGYADDSFKYTTGKFEDEKINIYDDVVFLRESLIIGAGVETAIAENVSLVTGVKFDNGFLNIMQESKRYNTNNENVEPKVINNFIELTIGVLF